MKTKNLMNVMGLVVVTGCLLTYLFIDFYNNKSIENHLSPKTITYDEVYAPAVKNINDLIAAEKNKNAEQTVFINNLKKEMLDTLPVYPLVVLWASISVFGFILIREKEMKQKSIIRSYEKMLDHLEISYSQEHINDKNNFDEIEPKSDYRPVTEDV